MRRSWGEFRDRKVVQWSLGYLAAAWVLYQVLSQVAENFAWPPAIMRGATVLLAVGLPVAAVLAWYHGEKGRQKVGLAEVVLLGACGLLGAIAVRAVTVGTGREAPQAEAPPAVLLNSIAVLPLTNRGEADQEYFADGLTEELMGALSRVPGLRVAARTSSFAFRDRRVGMDSVAAALRVRHLLDGSVQRRGDSVRVSVALIDSRNHYELWNASYRRPLADIFALQQEIARAVVEALPLDPVLLAGDWTFQPHTAELPAYDLFLLGRQAWN
ncbi:MAG: hypothetical protein KY466_12315, partial [Gemmatimonadetes bacterium]|nr:hypothetical protein [Gemmatimonadota bacterium]